MFYMENDRAFICEILQFLHDPDEYMVIADSFDDCLQDLILKDQYFH